MKASIGPMLAALALITSLASPAQAREYQFTRVADSVADNFNSFTCASINKHGDVAFKASRTAADGFNFFDGIYRRNANGTLTTIVEDPNRVQFGSLGNFLSMNDDGMVSFGAFLAPSFDQAILVGDGGPLRTIADTRGEFRFLGFDTSIDKHGEVAFIAQLDQEFNSARGLFSGSGGAVTTHYLNSADVNLDGQPARFFGSFDRPSINKHGEIAFHEFLQPNFESGVFLAEKMGQFSTVAIADPFQGNFGTPVLNDKGTAVFERTFFDEDGNFVTAIVTSDGGPLKTVVDTRGPFGFFGFRPPAINSKGDVVFFGILDDFSTSGIFTGPNPATDKVIATGDALDGATVSSFGLHFCEEGVNESGQVTFIADLDDPNAPFGFRSAVFVATPVK